MELKTKEQIETAQKTIALLQDYVELAKVQKKLKDAQSIEVVGKQIYTLNETIFVNIKEL